MAELHGKLRVDIYDQCLADARDTLCRLGEMINVLKEDGHSEQRAVELIVTFVGTWDITELQSIVAAAALEKSRE